MQQERQYIAIDLKSFYASVECRERGLDPLTTNLVVADVARTEKTICLAVSPSLKAYGIPGRARLFEVVQRVKEVNKERRNHAPDRQFSGQSFSAEELKRHPELELSYIAATPRMALYMQYSTKIYQIYLRYIAPEDIQVYSVDEVFMDVTGYLAALKISAQELAARMMRDVLEETGITATAGIGTNLYLCKVAMDIVAKHAQPDGNGMRMGTLDERSYRELLWDHRPLTDFWRVGNGYRKKLEGVGLFTMGDVARCSVGADNEYYNEDLLYQLFGVNAELLIDHAWGYEPVTMAQIKAYKPQTNSISSGQVLQCPYEYEKAELIVREMTDQLVLELVDKHLVTDQMVLTIGYDIDNLTDPDISKSYAGEVVVDRYGRKIPKHAHGTVNLERKTSSTRLIMEAVTGLYRRIADPKLLVRRITLVAAGVEDESSAAGEQTWEQLELFTDYEAAGKEQEAEQERLSRERRLQEAVIDLKKKYGKNAVLKGMDLQEGATMRDRNRQIGGHKA